MNKNRMILAASGGVIGVAVLATAYLTWSAYAGKVAAMEGDDESEGLETVLEKAQSLSRKGVYPCGASVKAIGENAARVEAWRTEALKLASRGDRPVRKMTPAQFKTDLVADAKRLSALPGAVNGVLVKPDFAFGPFRSYIAEGKMPAEAELPVLQRQWDDVMSIVETLGACGITELVDVAFKADKVAEPDEAANKAKGKKIVRKGKKPAADGKAFAPSAYSYVLTFKSRGPAFVKAVNALGTSERFTVVDDFSFQNTADPISDALGGAQKRDSQQASGRGRRGRRRVAVEEEKPEEQGEKKNGIVTDPLQDEPFTVVLTVTVYDFKTLAEDEKTEEAGK